MYTANFIQFITTNSFQLYVYTPYIFECQYSRYSIAVFEHTSTKVQLMVYILQENWTGESCLDLVWLRLAQACACCHNHCQFIMYNFPGASSGNCFLVVIYCLCQINSVNFIQMKKRDLKTRANWTPLKSQSS